MVKTQMNVLECCILPAGAIMFFCFVSVQLIPQYGSYYPVVGSSFYFVEYRVVDHGWPVTIYTYEQKRTTHEEIIYHDADLNKAYRDLQSYKANNKQHNDSSQSASRQIAPPEVRNLKGKFFPSF